MSKNYLITGAARGIGRGLSRLLLQNGHRVLLLDSNSAELCNTAKHLSQAQPPFPTSSFRTHLCDLRQPTSITAAAALASDFFSGHLDVLINNAAYTSVVGKSHPSELSLEDWNTAISTNLTAPFLLTQACLPLLSTSPTRAQGGSIINISSTRALQSEPNNEAYSATKAGLLGLTQSLAVSLAEQGVRVNAILPGWIHVENECQEAVERGKKWEEGLTEGDHRWHLTGRVGKVEDVSKAVEFLVGCEGVTGSEVVVDGGVTRKMVYPE
ncbi:unnamed protein product [Zymoseptoria tritici ST99CH_3D7]|uniref:Uncharacterized protein n=1 Tax=Zymoseptoria tritici (strain ST99CH_3D7) TaxID=1276538 RepID=A0A1X7RLS6_ZYMT9|nr:unnamed protein product [Zymoseptoria tritici ST99CH_3D7]